MERGDENMSILVRPGTSRDAPLLAGLISSFNEEEGSPGRINAAGVVDLCFSSKPFYQTIVAEAGAELVGYTLMCRHFDTEFCAWGTYMQDLFVVRAQRGKGVGRRLIASVAKKAMAEDHQAVFWHVRDRNRRGRSFYASVGGEEESPIPMVLRGKALKSLAETET